MGSKIQILILCIFCVWCAFPLTASSQPQLQPQSLKHVLSLNLCSDQLLLSLLPPDEIAGLSPLARVCPESILCKQARLFPSVRAEGEEILPYHPTHILISPWTRSSVQKIAQLRSIPTYTLPASQKLGDIPKQIRALASWLGIPQKGDVLAQHFEQEEQTLLPPPLLPPLKAAFYNESDDPLLEDMIKKAGFLSLAGTHDHYRIASLETLIATPPDLLVSSALREGESLKEAKRLPVFLQKRFSKTYFLIIPMKLTLCGSPDTLEALKLLRKAHQTLITETLKP